MGWLTETEHWLLTASLIEAASKVANVAGTYAAYLKRWDPRAHKPLLYPPLRSYTAPMSTA